MAVSGVITFALSGSELVLEARRKAGIQPSEEPMEAHELTEGFTALNMMLKAWQTDGVMYWSMTEGTLALVQGTASYIFGTAGAFTTRIFDLIDMRINRGGNDLPMWELSREDYYALPNKTSQGYPTQWFFDRQRDNGTLYVWPAPDVTAGTLKFTYRRVLNDIVGNADSLDLPQEWYEALVYNLADRLLENYNMANDRITAKALASYKLVKDFDVGEGAGSFSILPAYERRR